MPEKSTAIYQPGQKIKKNSRIRWDSDITERYLCNHSHVAHAQSCMPTLKM